MDISNIDKSADLSGARWISDIPDHPGLKLNVRSQHYKPYQVAMMRVSRDNRKEAHKPEGMANLQRLLGGPLADHILLGWQGVVSGGKEVEYSKDLAKNILTADDPHGIASGFRSAVSWASEQAASQIADDAKAAAGNSLTSSDGNLQTPAPTSQETR